MSTGGSLVVVALGIWEHQMVLYAVERLPEFEPPKPGYMIGRQIKDDAGTTYAVGGGSSSGTGGMRFSDFGVIPCPALDATKLWITGPRMDPAESIEVDLSR